MTDNIFELVKTNQALGDLSETIIRLDTAFKTKRQQVADERTKMKMLLKEQEVKLTDLQTGSTNVLENIDSIISNLDNILENNGTGNNNN